MGTLLLEERVPSVHVVMELARALSLLSTHHKDVI